MLGEILGPAGLPGPHLRCDVVQDGDPATLGLPRDPQIEAGIVDGNYEIYSAPFQEADDAALQPPEEPQAGENLDEAHHCQLVQAGQELDPLLGHSVPTEAHKGGVRQARAYGSDNVGAVEVARRFPCQNQDDRPGFHAIASIRNGIRCTR